MNLILPIDSLLILSFLLVMFFSKKKISSGETRLYSILLFISLFNIIFNIVGIYLGYNNGNMDFLYMLNHFDLPLYLWWVSILFLYLYYVCNQKNKKKNLKIKKTLIIVNIIFTIISIFLPIKVIINEKAGFATGLGVNFIYILCSSYLLLCVIISFILIINKNFKKSIPMVALIILGIMAVIIQKNIPTLIIIPAVMVFVLLIMYFTIENPDIKLLEEIRKAKDKADDLNEDKTDFIFNITSGMKENLNDIDNNIDIISNSKDIEEIKSNVNNIKNIVNSSKILLYKNLNITEQDIKDIELINNKYNIRNLVKQILYFDKGNKRETLDLRVNIEKSVPDYLYGDSIKLKQILTTILDNSIRHTDRGFIELNINCIKKYEVCRLLITLEDSGRGMSNEMIDDILSKDNLNRKYISRNLDLKSVNKIINLIGGTFSISSKLNVGTKIEITIDQKIVNNNEKKIDSYVDNIKKKKILLVDENIEEIDKTKKILEKYNYYVDTVIWGEQCLNKVRSGERFDLIIMDYDMPKLNGIEVYNRLKKVNNFRIPVVMITDSIDDKVRDKYKDLGIYEVIAKPLTKDKIDNLVKEINF